MLNKDVSPLPIGAVLAHGVRAFFREPAPLMARSLLLLTVPAVVLLIWQASESTRETNPLFFWVYLLIWLGSFVVAGYLGWPLARAALAAASPDRPPQEGDWWVRDGFVRATAVFSSTVAVGFLFLLIPGLMVLMIYTFYPFLIIERKSKGFLSLAVSAELTRGNRMRLLVLVLVLTVLFIPAGWLFYLWTPGTLGILAFWLLGAPALAIGAATVAAAYRAISDLR